MPYKDLQKRKEKASLWYLNNKQKVKNRAYNWAKNNPERIKQIKQKWRTNNKDVAKALSFSWKKNNLERVKRVNKQWYKKNIDSIKSKRTMLKDAGYYREYYKKNAERLRSQQNARRLKNPEKFKEISRKSGRKFRYRKYGISNQEYIILSKEQKYLCKICKEKKKLFVDHCHKTGKVRGLLCHTCNAGIGLLRDNKTILLSAIDYLN
jgi:hypothetical protein